MPENHHKPAALLSYQEVKEDAALPAATNLMTALTSMAEQPVHRGPEEEWQHDDASAPVMNASEAAAMLGLPYREHLAGRQASAEFTEHIPIRFAREHGVLGLAGEEDTLQVAIHDVRGLDQLQTISRFLGRRVEPLLVPVEQIAAAINVAYQQRTGQAQTLIETLDQRSVLEEVHRLPERDDLLDVATRAPVIKLVSLILFEAVKLQASDVHIQPAEDVLVVRLRIDGLLYDCFRVPGSLQEEVISRIKVMAHMNIAEKRLAQDGRATVQVGDRVIDLRVATLPTRFGERVVIRLLDKSVRLYSLGELGMDEQSLGLFRQLIKVEHGIILVTGPTGSGKTTTLYAALQEINSKERNIITLEDPIEYGLEGISQTQINEKKGTTFATSLRNVLRQDPDIIMVGEIRDHETAVMAIQSALTGHLVFSTLHTNDAASAITRLLDLGIEPYLLASSLVGVLAQRLVRRLCSSCAKEIAPSPDDLAFLGDAVGPDVKGIKTSAGCEVCRQTGYRGRAGIFELLTVDDAVRSKIHLQASALEINAAALPSGMKTLRDDGIRKVLAEITTIDEVLRVTMRATSS